MTQRLAATRTQGDNLSMAEHLFATGQRELIDQLESLGMLGIVLDLRLDKYGVALGIVPDVDAKGFYAHSIRLDKTHGTEDAKGLAAF